MTTFRTTRTVEFADTDMDGLVHFSRFFVFMETAEHQMLAARGVELHFEHDGQTLSWPRIAVSCEYQNAARFGDRLDIEVSVARVGRSSVTYDIVVSRQGAVLAKGRTTSACCVVDDPAGLRAVAIPDDVAERLGGRRSPPAGTTATD